MYSETECWPDRFRFMNAKDGPNVLSQYARSALRMSLLSLDCIPFWVPSVICREAAQSRVRSMRYQHEREACQCCTHPEYPSTLSPRLFPIPSSFSSAVNHALFVTTFLRSMPEGAKARRGYERLIGWGRVPGERASFSAERGQRERVTSWREAADVLDLSMASILRVPEV